MAIQNYYVYLVSSLPALQLGIKPPFTFERFLEISSQYIPSQDAEVLKESSISGDYDGRKEKNSALGRWRAFDTSLRNEIVKIRAQHKRIDPSKFMREGALDEAGFAHIAMTSHRNPSPLEAERALDEARWDALDALEFGHYFDLDKLVIYAHKLLILERWDRINAADKTRIVEELAWQKNA